jgi:hypothetical protein
VVLDAGLKKKPKTRRAKITERNTPKVKVKRKGEVAWEIP